MRATFLPLAAPSSLSLTSHMEPRSDSHLSLDPEPLGSWSGSRSRTRCGESAEPQGTPAPGSLQDLPTPTPHSLRAAGCPRALPSEGTWPHISSVPYPPNCGTKDPAAAGELGGKDWCSGYIPGPVGCHAADTPAAPAARARHATPVVATPARRRGCTQDRVPEGLRLRTHRLR